MANNCTADCLRRASWYITRINDLQRVMTQKPVLDGDDVEQCQAMLREIRAQFRADQRMPPRGQLLSQTETGFRSMLAEANALLRIPVGSRPAGRWRIVLAECEAKIHQYAGDSVVEPQEARPAVP